MTRQAAFLAALLISAWLPTTLVAAAPDSIVGALGSTDVFVSPAVQTDPVAATAVLTAAAKSARAAGEPLKFAVVPGPAGAPSMLAYATTLRRDLHFRGRVVVSAPGRAVAVAGPEDRAKTTLALREAKVGQVQDVVERALAAAKATQPTTVRSERGSGTRGFLGLLGLALIGGVWAVAIGMRRRQGVDRQRFHAARLTVSDALDELASCLERADPVRPQGAGSDSVDLAAREYAAAREEFGRAQDLAALIGTGARVRGALKAVEQAGIAPASEITAGLDRVARLEPLP